MIYKGLRVTHEVSEKIAKTAQKLLLLACRQPFTEYRLENSNFPAVFFFDFRKDFVRDEQIKVKQHTQAGPGTIHIKLV